MASGLLLLITGGSEIQEVVPTEAQWRLSHEGADMELTPYILIHDQGEWCGYRKDHPNYRVHGKSFEDLRLKLYRMLLDISCSTSSPGGSNTTGCTAIGHDQFLKLRNEG